mmetsp:Transcript_23368/g.72494  ORF Transcript_23368/g.72494 Transcript_23368/m.72494 type:complete len:153 (-) Transcript_23368:80-538(-)
MGGEASTFCAPATPCKSMGVGSCQPPIVVDLASECRGCEPMDPDAPKRMEVVTADTLRQDRINTWTRVESPRAGLSCGRAGANRVNAQPDFVADTQANGVIVVDRGSGFNGGYWRSEEAPEHQAAAQGKALNRAAARHDRGASTGRALPVRV